MIISPEQLKHRNKSGVRFEADRRNQSMKTSIDYKSRLARVGITLLITSLVACDRGADPDMNAGNAGASPGYDAGYEFGFKLSLLRHQHPDIGLDEALNGLRDALSETGQPISSANMCARLQPVEEKPAEVELRPETFQPPETQPGSDSVEVDSANDDDNAPDADNEGVVTLPSGVQYEVLLAGSGEPPQAGDSVLISYEGRLPDGTVFDTTYDVGPLQMSLDDIVVPGLKEALLLMNTGSRWHVVIPTNRGFSTGNRMFRRHDLIYDIELVSIDRAQPAEAGY
jgi:FKBP-type peptidyl-prolyl cis-trans isomerase FklB